MKVSIIVPVYNVENYINKCIDSIINQTYQNIEIILVNDGSTDNSGKICDDYEKKDRRIKVIHQVNGGLSNARNNGLNIATGNYVMYLDSDDYLELTACEELIKVINETNSDIVCFNFKAIDENDNDVTVSKIFSSGNSGTITTFNYKTALIDNIYRRNIRYEAGSKIYKNDIAKSHLFKIGILAEDFNVFYKYLKVAQKIVHYDKQLYFYLQRSDSIMGRKKTKLYFDIYLTEREFHNEIKENVDNLEALKQNENRHLRLLLKIYAKTYSNDKFNIIKDNLISDIKQIDLNNIFISNKILFYVFSFNKNIFSYIFNIFYKGA